MHQNEVISLIADALPEYYVWSNRVPKNTPTPDLYILLTDIAISEYAECKGGNEWLISMNIDVNSVYEQGYDTTDIVNAAVSDIIQRIKALPVVKNSRLEGSRSMTYDTPTHTVTRQILTFSFWVNR